MLPALIRKFHDAKVAGSPEVEVWGSGSPMREFLHVDDLADACLFLMEHYSDDSHINVGTGVDLSIRDLAEKVRDVVEPARRAGLRHARSPTARRARCSTSARCAVSAGRPRSGWTQVSRVPTGGSLINNPLRSSFAGSMRFPRLQAELPSLRNRDTENTNRPAHRDRDELPGARTIATSRPGSA